VHEFHGTAPGPVLAAGSSFLSSKGALAGLADHLLDRYPAAAMLNQDSTALCGFAEFDITPPLGVDLTGYGGRPGPADHVLSRLHARALAIAIDAAAPVALVSLDLLGISPEMVAAVRARLAGVVPAERLALNCTHTHAGPTTAALGCMGKPDPAYCELVVRWTVSAVREALRELRPARLLFGTAPTAIGLNRRELRDGKTVLGQNREGAYDPLVYALRVEALDGQPLACWFSHATHPVVMGSSNTGLSAEWPGEAARVVSAALGCPALFAQGCCGDVNPVRRGGFDVVQSVGRELAGAALAAWERAEPLAVETGVVAALETADLPVRVPSVREAERALSEAQKLRESYEAEVGTGSVVDVGERAIPREMVRWANDYLAAAKVGTAEPARMEVQAVRLGDLAVATTSAETFIEIGQEIQRRSSWPRTVALGYTNGCYGYLPTAKAFPLGGYEVDGAHKYYGTLMVTPECEERTLDAAERVMAAVRREP
jgi:neutral ceramidase